MDKYKNHNSILTERFPHSHHSERDSTKHKGAQYYAVVPETQLNRRFRLYLRNGGVISLPYSILPYYILTPSKDLIIKAPGILIKVCGVNLERLLEYLGQERLAFLKESPSGINDETDGTASVFIENIIIEGDTLQLFEEN